MASRWTSPASSQPGISPMGRPVPQCGECGERHFNFLKCDEAEAWDLAQQARRVKKQKPPVIVRQPRSDGLRDWRHQLGETTVRLADNRLVTKRPVATRPGQHLPRRTDAS